MARPGRWVNVQALPDSFNLGSLDIGQSCQQFLKTTFSRLAQPDII